MSQEIINVGSAPNDGLGDPIRTAFIKTNNNFSQLFATSSISNSIGNGSSTVSVPTANGAIIMTVSGNTSATFFTTGVSLTGNVTSGNINTVNLYANYLHGDGSNINFNAVSGNIIPAGNAVYSLGNATNQWKDLYVSNSTIYLGNIPLTGTSNTLSFAGNDLVSANTPINGNLSVTGNVYGGRLFTSTGVISTAFPNTVMSIGNTNPSTIFMGSNANITMGNVSKQTTINGNTSIVGNLSTTGNIVAGNIGNSITYLYGDGSNITNVSAGTYGNSNVAAYLPTNTANITGFKIGNATTFLYGDGSNITNVSAGNYGNSNVSIYLSSGANPNNIITTANLSATGNVVGNNAVLGGVLSATGNVRGGNINTAGAISAAGNIVSGNVSTAGVISATGNIVSGNVSTGGDVSATGNVVAAGFLTNTGTFRLPSYTSTQISGLAAVAGDLVYNSTLGVIQGYQINPATGTPGWVSWTVATYQ